MKIFYDELKSDWLVADRRGERPLREFTKEKRLELGLTISGLETQSGINHPLYLNFETGGTRSSLTGLRVLEYLGFELYIFGHVKDKNTEAEGVANVKNSAE